MSYPYRIRSQYSGPKRCFIFSSMGLAAWGDFSAFCDSVEEVKKRRDSLRAKIVGAEHRMKEVAILQIHITKYIKTKDVLAGCRKSGYSRKYYDEHADEIELCKK